MKTIKIAVSLALGMISACYVGAGDELEPGIGYERDDKVDYRVANGSTTTIKSNCDDQHSGPKNPPQSGVGLGLAAPTDTQSQQQPPLPPGAATEQELIEMCEEQEGIDMQCEALCEGLGLVFTGEVGIDPATIMVSVSPPQDTGMMCPNDMPEMTQATTTSVDCTCCCAAPPAVP